MAPVQQSGSLSETKRRLLEGYRRGAAARDAAKSLQILPRPAGQPAPLSSAQLQILQREQRSSDGSLPHNECITIRPNRLLDPDVLQRCLAEIIRRHEIWRTTYSMVDGRYVQIVHDAQPTFPLQTADLRTLSPGEREAELAKVYGKVKEPFDLERGPLLHVTLVWLSESEQHLVIFAHLSVVDGVSVYQILPAELSSLYEAFAAGASSPLPELALQYGDYAHWQQQWLKSPEAETQLDYWRKQLTHGLPAQRWPSHPPTTQGGTHRGAVRPFALRSGLRHAFKQFGNAEGATLFATLATNLGILLHCYTNSDLVVLGTPSLGGRKRPEVRGLLGHFLNPVPLLIDCRKNDCRENPTFHELLARVQQALGGALAHDDLPLEVLSREFGQAHEVKGNELFSVAISLQPAMPQAEWQVTSMDADSGGTIFDLYLAFIETAEGLTGRAQYNTDIFDDATIARTLDGMQAVMESVVRDPGQPISALLSELQRLGLS